VEIFKANHDLYGRKYQHVIVAQSKSKVINYSIQRNEERTLSTVLFPDTCLPEQFFYMIITGIGVECLHDVLDKKGAHLWISVGLSI
jgi:hypothetical protein